MEAPLFTSFGLLLLLLMRKPKRRLLIAQQFDICIHSPPATSPTEQPPERQSTMAERRRKNKKSKKLNRQLTEEITLYPRVSYPVQAMEEDWQQTQHRRSLNCKHIGREVESLLAYFVEEVQTRVPYNGATGSYQLSLPIPGATYSDIPIDINFPAQYPLVLPQVEIHSHNLHPLELQKLNEIVKQHQALFHRNMASMAEDTNSSESGLAQVLEANQQLLQMYLGSYYPYVFSLCVSLSQELFYRPDLALQPEDANASKNINNSKADPGVKLNKIKEDIENNKEIYQNILEEIFNQHDIEDKNLESLQKPFEINIPRHPNIRGRYQVDYQELDMIGEGGFGRVYKCRNRIDSNIYAVKKMVINYNDPQSRKLLKEVALLSKLNHPNIVRYHQSWLEDTASVEELIADMSISEPEEIQEFNKIWKQYSLDHPANEEHPSSVTESEEESERRPFQADEDSVIFGDDIIFEDYSNYVEFRDSKAEGEKSKQLQYEDSSQSNSSVDKLKARKHSQLFEFPFKILYIVMEFCGSMTLRDFINTRFSVATDVKIKLIRGMLEGLSYIHSRRIIHRDLKPANIFLIENTNKVKIGDFGLATIGNIENNPYEAQIIEYSEKTKGVGTSFYRAPEQLSSSHYDQKIDIYSLGIIMLELFYQFGTNMERYDVLTQVTKNHRLPKDFNKMENNSQFEEQIQSCISVRPVDRPTVQKLLETFRNKYFTQLVSLIANPKHFQFYQLMNHLFSIRNETSVLMKQNLYRNYLTHQFTQIYQIHRGVLFTPISLVPLTDYETLNAVKVPATRKDKFLLLSERGVVMEYPANTYVSWIRYARETLKRNQKAQPTDYHYKQEYIQSNKELRRFTFEKVAEFIGGDSKSEFSFKEKFVTAFDISYSVADGLIPYFLSEILQISLLMIETMDLTQRSPPIYLCHSLLFKCLALEYNVPLVQFHKCLLSVTDEKFRSLKNQAKVDYLKSYGIEGNLSKKMISLMDLEHDDPEQFIKSCKLSATQHEYHKNPNSDETVVLFQQIEDYCKSNMESFRIFHLHSRIKWKLQIPPPSTHGLFWNVGPVKGFTSIDEYLPDQEMCNLHIETPLNPSPYENEADVSIWSNGEFLQQDILEIVAKCWESNLTAKWYDQSQGEKDLSCRYNIILKKKNERVYLMLRKNNIGYDRVLEKKSSEEKEEKESSFMLKENFDYEVLKNMSRESLRRLHMPH